MKEASIHSCCEILNVSLQSNINEIKMQTRRLLLKYHPDVNSENKSFFEEKTKEILAAYERLIKIKSTHESQEENSFNCTSSARAENNYPPKNTSLIIFKIVGVKYGIFVNNVQEIIRAKDVVIKKVSDESKHISGFILWREKVVPLYNFKYDCIDKINGEQIIIVKNPPKMGGLLIDGVDGIINISSNFESTIQASYSNYLLGTYRVNGDVFCILNIDKIIC